MSSLYGVVRSCFGRLFNLPVDDSPGFGNLISAKSQRCNLEKELEFRLELEVAAASVAGFGTQPENKLDFWNVVALTRCQR